MKEELLAAYTMGARHSYALNFQSGKPPEVQLSLPIPNGHNLRNNLGRFRNKGYIGSLLGFYKT